MFARDKRIGPYTYVYLVENVREEGRTKQRIIANLGRKEVVVARGDLDRLARSVVRLAQRSMVLSLVEGEAPPNARCQRIGPALLFERLWHEVGCRAVLEELAAGRRRAAWSSRPLERPPPGSPSDDRRAGHGSGRQAAVLRAVARQYRRRDHPCAGRRPVARAF